MRDLSYLVVDDSQVIRNLVVNILKNAFGATRIAQACNGEKALKILNSLPIEMVISDWNMPIMDGAQLLDAIRKSPALGKIPFIMITSNGEMKFIMQAKELGVTDYVVKPFSPNDLEKKLRSAWAASAKRLTKRHASLPRHNAMLRIKGTSVAATIENISLTGTLLHLSDPNVAGLYDSGTLDIQVDNICGDRVHIESLHATAIRIEGKSPFDPVTGEIDPVRRSGGLVAFCFHPKYNSQRTLAALTALIEWLASRDPDQIGDAGD